MNKNSSILNSTPDTVNNTKNGIANIYPLPVNFDFDVIYLFGVLSTKWWINHDKKRIRVYLPESKRYLAQLLKSEWGGTISNVNRPKHHGVMWQTTSTRSLLKIEKAATAVKPWLPLEFYKQLTAFTKLHV